jgi:hypothetical protein
MQLPEQISPRLLLYADYIQKAAMRTHAYRGATDLGTSSPQLEETR